VCTKEVIKSDAFVGKAGKHQCPGEKISAREKGKISLSEQRKKGVGGGGFPGKGKRQSRRLKASANWVGIRWPVLSKEEKEGGKRLSDG